MFTSQVYKIAITSLGAILEEEHIAYEVINEWNIKRAEETKKVFLTVPNDATDTPDLYCVIVDSYVDEAKVNQMIETGKPVLVLFSKYHDPKNSIQTEIDKVQLFRANIQGSCICVDYDAAIDFGVKLIESIGQAIETEYKER